MAPVGARHSSDADDLTNLADLVAALGEHVRDLDRRVNALENGLESPKSIAASELGRITKGLMTLSLARRRRLGRDER